MPEVVSYFEEVRKDLSESLEIFLEDNEEQAAIAYASLDKKMPRRYLVNVLHLLRLHTCTRGPAPNCKLYSFHRDVKKRLSHKLNAGDRWGKQKGC